MNLSQTPLNMCVVTTSDYVYTRNLHSSRLMQTCCTWLHQSMITCHSYHRLLTSNSFAPFQARSGRPDVIHLDVRHRIFPASKGRVFPCKKHVLRVQNTCFERDLLAGLCVHQIFSDMSHQTFGGYRETTHLVLCQRSRLQT